MKAKSKENKKIKKQLKIMKSGNSVRVGIRIRFHDSDSVQQNCIKFLRIRFGHDSIRFAFDWIRFAETDCKGIRFGFGFGMGCGPIGFDSFWIRFVWDSLPAIQDSVWISVWFRFRFRLDLVCMRFGLNLDSVWIVLRGFCHKCGSAD